MFVLPSNPCPHFLHITNNNNTHGDCEEWAWAFSPSPMRFTSYLSFSNRNIPCEGHYTSKHWEASLSYILESSTVDCLKKLSACKYAYNWHVNCMIGWGHDMLQATIRLWCVLTLSCSKYKVMLMGVRKDFHHLAWVDQSTSHFICRSLLRYLYLRDHKHCIWNTVPPLHLVYFDVRWNDVNFDLQ